jgi:hypothetical protein
LANGKISHNEQVLPMVGELKILCLATEVHYSFKDEKFILMFKKSSFCPNPS